jgi:hypothetical protein
MSSTFDAARLDGLLKFVRSEGRVCPHRWHDMWEMLPDRKRVGAGWHPPLPLILGAWSMTTDEDKRLRLKEHIEYGAQHGVLEDLDVFLRGLPLREWHCVNSDTHRGDWTVQ